VSIPSPEPQQTSRKRSRVTTFVRVWAVLQLVATVLAAPFVLGLFSYGLAHAEAGAQIMFTSVFLLAVAVLAGAPLALLLNRGGVLITLGKMLGVLLLLAGAALLVLLTYGLIIDPELEARKFEEFMDSITVDSVDEAPVEIAGRVAGLRLVARVRLSRELTFRPNAYDFEDRIGDTVEELLHQMQAGISDGNANIGSWPPFGYRDQPEITLDGTPLRSTPGFREFTEHHGQASVTMPVGIYRVEQVFWQMGLAVLPTDPAEPDGSRVQCRVQSLDDATLKALAFADGRPLEMTVSARFSLGGRRGYRGFATSVPLATTYAHPTWLSVLPTLPLPVCESIEQAYHARQLNISEKAVQAARAAN